MPAEVALTQGPVVGGVSGDRLTLNRTLPKGFASGQLWQRLAEVTENVMVHAGWLVEIDNEAFRSGRGSIPGYGTPPGEYLTPIKALPDWYVPASERSVD